MSSAGVWRSCSLIEGSAVLAVTKKVAKEWKIDFASCEVVSSGRWVVDFCEVENGLPLCLATHQNTLFTMVFCGRLPNPKEVLARIGSEAPWFQLSIAGLFARNGNRRVTGSMTDMKYLASSVAVNGGTEQEMQDFINKTPFSMLGMDRPNDAVATLTGEANKS